MKTALMVGLKPLEFWEMTPRELNICVEVFVETKKIQSNDSISVAYITAMWVAQWFSKKPPQKLEKILNKEINHKEMTDEEMINAVKNLNALFGGQIILNKKGG